ncbi:MAG: Helix-turn-helix domain [Firmicutes bacterium]|nr:Helix-turn-helix domain [Bacillota bacterium]
MTEYNNWDTLPLTLSVKETAQLTGYGQAIIRDLCRSRRIPCLHLGRAFRIPKDALRNWLNTECYQNGTTA